MGGTASSAVLMIGAVATILCAAAALVFYVLRLRTRLPGGRRRRYGVVALVLAGLSVALLAAEETVPRLLAGRELHSECLPGPVSISVVSTPITWQVLIGGGIMVDAEIGHVTVEKMIDDRLEESPLADAEVTVADDHIEISKTLESRFGELPLVLALSPAVSDGKIEFEPSSLHVNGVALSPSALNELGQGGAAGLARGGDLDCRGGDGSSVDLVSASITHGGFSLRLRP